MNVSVGPTSRCGGGSSSSQTTRGQVEHPHAGKRKTVEQAPVRVVGEQDLAVGLDDVAGQGLARRVSLTPHST